jgi:hypothetical protein
MSDEVDGAATGSPAAKASKAVPRRPNSKDYDVGYKKPPRSTRFKKGQSGNPKGSQKKQRIMDVRILLDEILAEPVKIRDDGRVRTVSKLEAMFYAQRMNALKGNRTATRSLFKLARKAGLFTRVTPHAPIIYTLPDSDQGNIVRAYRAEQEARRAAGQAPGDPPPPIGKIR